MGVTDDETQAMRQLLRREIDVIAEVPPNASELIRNSQPVQIELKHYEIDPFQIDYINVFGRVYVDEMNRRILQSATESGQQESAAVDDSLRAARQTTENLRQALRAADDQAAQQHQQELQQETDVLLETVGTTLGLAGGLHQAMEGPNSEQVTRVESLLTRIDDQANELGENDPAGSNNAVEQEKVAQLERDLTELETMLAEFQSIDSGVLVRPFRSRVESVAPVSLAPSDFFAPAVITLLLQHVAITFGALSIVRERREGTMELFSVSPISPFETLLSKYLSYFLFLGILTTILTLVVIYGLGVPMLGSWLYYSLSLAALVFTSLGIGFIISLVAETDTEAVQYSMIILLTSVFFSGAFIGLHLLGGPVQIVSWFVPATYGITLLQDIMLRGYLATYLMLIVLGIVGFLLFGAGWFLLRRRMSRI
jgi:ABC-2 type transport system permease protein